MVENQVSRRSFLQYVAFAGAGIGLAACTSATSPRIQEPEITAGADTEAVEQVLIVQQEREPVDGLDPAWSGGAAWATLLLALYRGLLFIDDTLELQPAIAEDVETSADNTVWTFHLRDDVKFNDGSPLTAEDVKYTYVRALTPLDEAGMLKQGVTVPRSFLGRQLLSVVLGALPYINGETDQLPAEAIEVIDPYTLQITLEQGRADFGKMIGSKNAGIVKRAQVEASEQGNVWHERPIGAGPFMVESWVHDQEFVLVPNPHFYGAPPILERVIMPIVNDPQTLLTMYENDELEVARPQLIDVEAIKKPEHPLSAELRERGELITAILHLNALPPLDDVHVRRALEFAIDKELLAQAVLGGTVEAAHTFLQPDHPGYNMDGTQLNYFDPERAKAELAASAYGGDLSTMPTIRVFVAGGLAGREGIAPGTWQRLAAAIQEMWIQTLGVPVEIKVVELESETVDTVAHINYTRWGAFFPDPIAMVERWVNDIANLEAVAVSDTRQPIGAPGLAEIYARVRSTSDTVDRWDALADFESLRAEYVPYIPIYFNRTYVLAKPWVQGLKLGHQWNYPLLNEVSITAH